LAVSRKVLQRCLPVGILESPESQPLAAASTMLAVRWLPGALNSLPECPSSACIGFRFENLAPNHVLALPSPSAHTRTGAGEHNASRHRFHGLLERQTSHGREARGNTSNGLRNQEFLFRFARLARFISQNERRPAPDAPRE